MICRDITEHVWAGNLVEQKCELCGKIEILKSNNLLQKLADTAHEKDAHEARNDFLLALRAVVELHKPAWYNSRDTDIKDAHCAGCDNRCGCYEGDILGYNRWENCPTIQAIEKELANG